ncbi:MULTISPECIES: VOC family protein [unclassified Schlesneria]|uniref:VOC family protein n=1 Tax=unclassified Schlesneria TaxID=2762017 RepID=UPI002F04038A
MNRRNTWFRVVCLTGVALTAFALGGFANQKGQRDSNFASQTIDLGMVVSDLDKSLKFYKDVLGFTEVPGFKVPGAFGLDTGLSNNIDLDVHVLVLGEGETATKLKLMQFKSTPGARVDNTFIHSSYGFRYLTIPVKNLNLAVENAAKGGGKPIAKCPVPLPEGFPAGLALANYRDPDGNLVELVGPWSKK